MAFGDYYIDHEYLEKEAKRKSPTLISTQKMASSSQTCPRTPVVLLDMKASILPKYQLSLCCMLGIYLLRFILKVIRTTSRISAPHLRNKILS